MANNHTSNKSIDGVRRPVLVKRPNKRAVILRAIKQNRIALIIVVAILVVAIIVWLLISAHGSTNSHLSGKAELNYVEKEVSRHYILPTNETPALATVTDKSKLTTPFFKNAQNGDKILIYENNKIAIIYRPSVDRIVSVGPVSLGTPGGQ